MIYIYIKMGNSDASIDGYNIYIYIYIYDVYTDVLDGRGSLVRAFALKSHLLRFHRPTVYRVLWGPHHCCGRTVDESNVEVPFHACSSCVNGQVAKPESATNMQCHSGWKRMYDVIWSCMIDQSECVWYCMTKTRKGLSRLDIDFLWQEQTDIQHWREKRVPSVHVIETNQPHGEPIHTIHTHTSSAKREDETSQGRTFVGMATYDFVIYIYIDWYTESTSSSYRLGQWQDRDKDLDHGL